MKTLIIIAVAVLLLIVVVGALFAISRKKKATNSGSGLNKVKKATLPKKPIAEVPQKNSSKQANIAESVLANAQAFINQQRYEEAEAELNKGLFVDPSNSELSLKLLNVYMAANKRDEFDNLFLKIQDNGDSAVTEEAMKLMLLMDEITINQTTAEAGITTPTNSASANENNSGLNFPSSDSQDSGLDFPGFGTEETTSTNNEPTSLDNGLDFNSDLPSSTNNDSLDLAFDGFEQKQPEDNTNDDAFSGLSLESEQQNTFETANLNDPFTDLDVNASDLTQAVTEDATSDIFAEFDAPTSPKDSNEQKSNNHANNNGIDFTQQVNDTNPFAELSLGDKPTVQAEKNTTTIGAAALAGGSALASSLNNQEQITESKSPDLDFNFNDLSESVSGSTPVVETDVFDLSSSVSEPESTSELSADFNFEELDTPVVDDISALTIDPVETTVVSIENASSEVDTMSDPFADIDMGISEPVAESAPVTDTSLDSSNEFDFSVTQPDTSTSTVTDNDNLADIDAFDFNTVSKTAVEAPAENVTDSFADVISTTPAIEEVASVPETVVAPVAEESTVPAQPVNADTSTLSQELNFVNELDSSEITLNLAVQYFKLGEYDSARRLLEEVAAAGSEIQVKKAKALLTQIG